MKSSTSKVLTSPTNFSGNEIKMENSSVKTNGEDGDVFYETAAAQGVSGLFVALAILITVHQARIFSKFNQITS